MPRAGETVANPATGETLTWVVTAADSGGSLLRVDVVMEPGRPGPPVHGHRAFPEHHDVNAGRLAIVVDGQERVLEAGATIDIPRGTPHTFRVVGDEQVRTVVDYAPSGRYEDFIDRLYALAREGKTDDKGAPRNILQTAVAACAHLDESPSPSRRSPCKRCCSHCSLRSAASPASVRRAWLTRPGPSPPRKREEARASARRLPPGVSARKRHQPAGEDGRAAGETDEPSLRHRADGARLGRREADVAC